MAPRGFNPNGSVTGIGSLPLADPEAAVQFIVENSPTLPFWPQLPRRSRKERLIGQGLTPLAEVLKERSATNGYRAKPQKLAEVVDRLKHGPAELHASGASGFFAFEKALARGAFPDAAALKGQIGGPITLASNLFDRDRPFAQDRLLMDAVASYVCRLAQWQVARLRRFGRPVILFVDEPRLGLLNRGTLSGTGPHLVKALTDVLEAIRNAGAMAGVHCCASFSCTLLRRTKPDIFSFDAYQGLENFCADPGAKAFFEEAGCVAFGLVPTRSRLDDLRAEELFGRWLQNAAKLGEAREVASRSFITATCGLGLLPKDAGSASFALCRSLARLVQQVAGP
ncbi:MAG: hypothetical protein ACE5JS_04195 [Nitrospinota bacterium]